MVFFYHRLLRKSAKGKNFFADFCALENFIVSTLVVWSVVREIGICVH